MGYLRDHAFDIIGIAVAILGGSAVVRFAGSVAGIVYEHPAEIFSIVAFSFGVGMTVGRLVFVRLDRKPLAVMCAPLSRRCRAMLIEAVENGEVSAYFPADSDASYLVDKGLLEAPRNYSLAFPVNLHIPGDRYGALKRNRKKLLGDIPPEERRRLVG
ncbi:hypothetical protein [Parafannyhessea umbonata]|uniref:hypothetical protein n=1 Tax=Parafannyhessea umbonata TaxID=604330 RepID=UPI00359CB581